MSLEFTKEKYAELVVRVGMDERYKHDSITAMVTSISKSVECLVNLDPAAAIHVLDELEGFRGQIKGVIESRIVAELESQQTILGKLNEEVTNG